MVERVASEGGWSADELSLASSNAVVKLPRCCYMLLILRLKVGSLSTHDAAFP
jgi:hypothetical protein